MKFLFFKILFMLLVLFLLGLPFLPWKLRCSLTRDRYEKKESWRNIAFVFEAMLVGAALLCLAPFMKAFFMWFFELSFMQKLLGKISLRATYTVEAAVVVLLNITLGAGFVLAKKICRALLDKYVFKNAGTGNQTADPNKQGKKKKPARNQQKKDPKQRQDLKQLRKESVLVFPKKGKGARVEPVIASDYLTQQKQQKKKQASNMPSTEDDMSMKQLIQKLWYAFIGIFYEPEEDYAYAKPGTYRWGKQLRIFGLLFGFAYLVLWVLVQLPIFFPLKEDSFVYNMGIWFLSNSYVCPVIALVLLCELNWFLGGEYRASDAPEAPFVTFVERIRGGKEVSLEKIKTTVLGNYGEKYKIRHFEAQESGGNSTYRLEDQEKAIQNIANAIRAKNGFVNSDYMQSVDYMLSGQHVLFDTVLYSALGDYMVHYLFVKLSFGGRVLFICKDQKEIENATAYLEESFRKLTKTTRVPWRMYGFDKLHEGEKPDILLLTPEQFLEPTLFTDGRDFFDELADVFVLDADKILTANNYYCLIMAKKLEKATTDASSAGDPEADAAVAVEKKLRYSFFSSGHILSLENSLRQFFNLENAPLKVFHSFALASRTEVFVWHTGFHSTLYVDNGANQVALEVQIAKDAAVLGVQDINLITDTAVYSSQRNEIAGLNLNTCALSDQPIGYVIVADDAFNLPNAIYNYSRFAGERTAVLHVVSKPYLLRDYFTANAEEYVAHFELIGKTMSEHAELRRASIIILLCDAVNGIERSVFMHRARTLLGAGENDAPLDDLDQCVQLCYKVAFGENREYAPNYSLKQELDTELQPKTFVTIKDSEHLFENLLEHTQTVKLEFINSRKEEYLPVFRDEITQHFLPGQVVQCDNATYTIKEMSVEKGVLVLDDTVPTVNVPMDYIQTRHYTVSGATLVQSFGQDYRAKNSYVNHVDFRIYDAQLDVDTLGYYSIEKALQTVDLAKPNFARYINLCDSPELREQVRRNIRTNMLVVELHTALPVEPKAGYLLGVMLHEFMKTVFPHQYRCVSVCYLFDEGQEAEFFKDEIAIRDLYPRMAEFVEDLPVREKTQENTDEQPGGKLRFAIIEDIQGGNGVVETLTDGSGIMITNLLQIAADFLSWMLSDAGKDYKYLNFGYEEVPAVFDMKGLDEVISQFRQHVERSELVRVQDDGNCFFCHRPMEDGKSEELPDGRRICERCRENSVQTYEELDPLLPLVLETIKNSTTAADTFPDDIKLEFVSTSQLRRRYGDDAQQLPISYCDHVNHVIYVEYGLPKSAICCCLARGITELWQDLNVNDDGSELFRAHPDCVELQVLSWLHMDTEAEALAAYYADNEALKQLKAALEEQGHQDTFAFFLGTAGKKNGGGVPPIPEEEDIVLISERNPDNLVKMHKQRLTEDEQAVYEQIYQAILEFKERTGPLVREVTVDRCGEIMHAVIQDNAEIFWVSNGIGSVAYNASGIAVDVIFKYVMTAAEAKRRKKQIEKAIKPFLKGIKPAMSDYEAALHAYENIVSIIDYDSIGLQEQERDPSFDDKPDDLRSIYGVYVQKKAVCAGYAKAFQYIVNRLGIECAYVRGQCNSGEWHAWNLLKLEGQYYYLDATWDDHTNTDQKKNGRDDISYDYFCITTQEIQRSRQIQHGEQFPDCTATACNYAVRHKLYFETYDAARIQKLVKAGLDAGKTHFFFKAKDAALMQLLKRRLITERGMADILAAAGGNDKWSSYYGYINEDVNVVHIILT